MAETVRFDPNAGVEQNTIFSEGTSVPVQGGRQSQGYDTNNITGGESFDWFNQQQSEDWTNQQEQPSVPSDYMPDSGYQQDTTAPATQMAEARTEQTDDTRRAIDNYQRQQQAQAQGIQQPQTPNAPQQQAMPQAPSTEQGQEEQAAVPADSFDSVNALSKRERINSLDQAARNGDPLAQRAFIQAKQAEDEWANVEQEVDKSVAMSARQDETRARVAIGDAATRAERRNNKRQAMSADNGQQQEKPFWLQPMDRLLRLSSNSLRRTSDAAKKAKRLAASAFKREGLGNRIWGKIIGDSSLSFREVGVGIQEILAVQAQDPEMLDKLLAPYLGVNGVEVSTATMSAVKLVDVINNNEVYVTTFKPPNNQGPDIQRRRLHIMTNHQRGIFLHNIMAAMYTADYDGDDMEISLDPSVANKAKDPMDHIYDIFGKTTLNMDFIKIVNIEDVTDDSGKVIQTREEYVRETILSGFDVDESGEKIDRGMMTPLVNSILKLAESAFSDEDAQAAAFGNVLREARKYADRTAVSNGTSRRDRKNASDDRMSRVVKAVFDNMQTIAQQNALTTIGADVLTLEREEIPEPVTYGDTILYTIIDGMVRGSVPNNFQEVKLLLTGFAGNVSGKNAPFRFTADVGKMAKMDSRLMVGNEFVVDPENENDLRSFFLSTAKYAASLRMMRDIKENGRKDYYMNLLRSKVIEEVGFPPVNMNEANAYSNWLMRFTDSYNKHSMTINQANKVYLTNMAMANEAHGVVSAINSSILKDKNGRTMRDENGDPIKVITLSDIAEPMLTIYGDYSIQRVFRYLKDTGRMATGNIDKNWRGRSDANPSKTHPLEREYDFIGSEYSFWITGKYMSYSLKKFRNENRLPNIKSDLEKAIHRQITDTNVSNTRLMFETMLAIADKRTGAASKFNEKTYGLIEKEHTWNERTTTKMMSQVLTSVAHQLRRGGMPIAPGFYAGIGSRKIPDDLAKHMTRLAKELSKYGYTLRSGDAKGTDRAFARGAGKRAVSFVANEEHWLSRSSANSTMVPFDNLSNSLQSEALDAIQRLHPNPDSFENDEYNRQLMARNYYQVAGYDGLPDSAFVACYATDDDSGTWHAIRVAHERGIPVFNLAEYSDPEDWVADVLDAAVAAQNGQLYTDPIDQEQVIRIEESLNTLISANRDMFMYYNMDSPATFLDSAYGHKLLQYAGDPEMIGGIYTSMVFDWRMERITSLTEDLLSEQTVDGARQTWDDLCLAKDELSAASEVWHGIIREFEMESSPGEKSFFQQIREQGDVNWNVNGRTIRWNVKFDAEDFWFDESFNKYKNLRQVIDDLDLDRTTKWNIITDVVRYWEKDIYLKSYEVGYQMEIANDSTYHLNSSPRAALESHRDFEKAFNKWGRSGSVALREDIERARATYGSTPGVLLRALTNFDNKPWKMISIDDGMYADAILAVYNKTYAQTEKANQHPSTNAIYSALCMQRNGGYMDDVTRTNNRLLGITSSRSISIRDIIHLLANPQESMTITVDGEWCVVSCETLLSSELRPEERTGDLEQDIWEFLNRQPRLASALRMHSACVRDNSDGEGYIGATASLTESIGADLDASDPIGQAKYILRDHPAYAAIIAMALPGRGLMARNARNRVPKVEDFFVNILCRAANSAGDDGKIPISAASDVLEQLGITRESVRSALKSDYDTYLEEMGLDAYKHLVKKEKKENEEKEEWVSESERDADDIYDYAIERVSSYIEELKKAGVESPAEKAKAPTFSNNSSLGPDAVSAAAFWDVVQELSGAKTSVSTGIEGGETFKYAEWISHMQPRDHFVDIMAMDDDFQYDENWNGLWTSLSNLDGSPVLLEFDETSGISLTMTTLGENNQPETNRYWLHAVDNGNELSFADAINDFNRAKTNDSEKINEVVAFTPDGYEVQDKSTDTHGLQIPSLFAYMVSKRTNGAEAFNLKAKKAGIDGVDSIIKMQGQHKTEKTIDENGNEIERQVNFLDVLGSLRSTYQNGGRRAATIELAKMMLKENEELGYKDLTLANYMSIADVMLLEGDDGELYVRSVEMLAAAIKSRIGWRGDEMTEDEIFDEAQRIVNDTTENGVGRKMLSSLEAFDSFRPRSRAMQYHAVQQQSSVFERNYPLLEQIRQHAENIGIQPIKQKDATELSNKNISRWFKDQDGRWLKKAKDLGDFLSGYDLTTVVNIGSESPEPIEWTIGPSNVVFITIDQNAIQRFNTEDLEKEVKKQYDKANELGMSVLMHIGEASLLPEQARIDAIPASENYVFVPCFDIRLNGSEATPSRGQWNISQTPFSKYVISVEDSINEFGLGDAEAQAFKALTDRMSMRDGGSQQIRADSLFPNVLGNPAFKGCQFLITPAREDTIAAQIVDDVRCTIDFGIPEGSSDFDRRVNDVSRAIKKYRQGWDTSTKGRVLNVDLEPGDIVGWCQCDIIYPDSDRVESVLAPIIPFQLHGVKSQPAKFKAKGITLAKGDGSLISVNWENTTSLTDGYVKYFDSSGGANKGMISLSATNQETRTLLDGTPIDIYIAKESTDSRKVGTDRRIKTMISMMTLARIHGYNFARKSDGKMNMDAFPENPTIQLGNEQVGVREALYSQRIPRDKWKLLLDQNIRFVTDDYLDAFIRFECNKIMSNGGNPSDYLANVYTDADGNESNTHVMWEFEAMFEQGLNYEDGLLKFMHFVNPIGSNTHGSVTNFCPNGIEDNSQNVLFRLQGSNGQIAEDYDRGVLQMRVPHKMSDGRMAYAWDNVSIGMSFFGEEYSGFSRPNVEGASTFLDGMNTMSMYRVRLREDEARHRYEWASSDQARPRSNGSLEMVLARKE